MKEKTQNRERERERTDRQTDRQTETGEWNVLGGGYSY